MKKMKVTSLLAFEDALQTIGQRQMLVFRTIKKIQPCSNLDISKFLNLPINTITPRCQELRKMNLVISYKKDKCKYTNRLVYYYKIPDWINQIMI